MISGYCFRFHLGFQIYLFDLTLQPDQTDNGLSVEEEWNLLSTEVPDEEDVDDDDDDDSFDNIIDANLLVGAQCAVFFSLSTPPR